MSSAKRLIEIMDLFTSNRATWTPLDAAQTLRMSRASSYRYFLLLGGAGYIEEVSGHRYALGPRIVELDRQIRLADPLLQVAADEMVKLAKQSGGVALLCRLYRDRVLCVHQERGNRAPGFVSYERGRAMPLYRGATSKVILALLPENELDILIEDYRGGRARADPRLNGNVLRKALETIRRERICVAYGEVDPDACGIAVPLCEQSRVIGSLSVVLRANDAKGPTLKSAMRLVATSGHRIEGELESASFAQSKRRRRR
jgi:DNA-binding IclR family transcriptional regulator